jgi:tetratricopeptide (TPR) repeat protein
MKKYDYKGLADSINFIIKPVVDDWTAFKAELNAYEGITSDEKSEYLNIVNGGASFEEKEKSLRKLASYKKVFKDVYPKLRTAKTEILKIKEKKTDAEMSVLAKQISEGAVADSLLTEEELMYAASLTPSLKEKEAIYTAATKKNDSWKSHNNLAATYIAMANEDEANAATLFGKAATQLEIANKKKESAEAYANLGSVYLMQGNAKKAYDALNKAASMGASNDVAKGMNGVKAASEIKLAKYADAVSSGASSEETAQNLFNKGLAQLLNKDFTNAVASFDEAIEKDNNYAMANYAAAVASARANKVDALVKYIKAAVAADPDLKSVALNDLEFKAFAGNALFTGALK